MGAGRTLVAGVALLAVALWFVLADDGADPRRDARPLSPPTPPADASPALPEPAARGGPTPVDAAPPGAEPERLVPVAQELPRDFLVVEVVSRGDATPIAGAQVQVVPARLAPGADDESAAVTAVTDTEGRCELAPPLGPVWITASVPGEWYGTAEHRHLGDEVGAVVRLELNPLTEMRGRVVDPSGAPIEGVRVSSMVTTALRAEAASTDADGRFAFGHLMVRISHAVDFARDGYGDETRHLYVDADGGWSITDDGFDLPRHPAPVFLELVMSPERVILGRVVDGAGRGLPDIEVRASAMVWTKRFGRPDERVTRTDADGAFELRGTRVENGYIVRADVPELGVAMQYAFPGEARVDLGALPLLEFVTLRGRLVDEAGLPAAGARIEVRATGLAEFDPALAAVKLDHEPAREFASATVGPDGRFEFRLPRLAALDLSVRVGSRIVQRLAPDLSLGDLDMGDVPLGHPSSLIAGRLLDAEGAPLADRRLDVDPRGGNAGTVLITDADGAFQERVFLSSPSHVRIDLAAEPGWLPEIWDLTLDGGPLELRARRVGE